MNTLEPNVLAGRPGQTGRPPKPIRYNRTGVCSFVLISKQTSPGNPCALPHVRLHGRASVGTAPVGGDSAAGRKDAVLLQCPGTSAVKQVRLPTDVLCSDFRKPLDNRSKPVVYVNVPCDTSHGSGKSATGCSPPPAADAGVGWGMIRRTGQCAWAPKTHAGFPALVLQTRSFHSPIAAPPRPKFALMFRDSVKEIV
jgi:hypothetical protein